MYESVAFPDCIDGLSGRGRNMGFDICFAMLVCIQLWRAVQRRPFWLVLEEAHGFHILFYRGMISMCVNQANQPEPTPPSPNLPKFTHTHTHTEKGKERKTHIILIRCKPMINARRQHNQIAFPQSDAHPLVIFTTDIEEPFPVNYIPNLLVLMQMLIEEHPYFVLVHITHLLG